MTADPTPGKSIDQRLYEAYLHGTGVRLTRQEVQRLVGSDNAIQMRICQQASREGGGAIMDGVLDTFGVATWADLKYDAKEASE